MTPGRPYQVLTDCPHCKVEAAVVELMDPLHPACHLGLPAERHCRLCAWREKAADEPFTARLPLHLGRCPACSRPLTDAERASGHCPHCDYTPRLEVLHEPLDLTDAQVARDALMRWAVEEGEDDLEVFCQANLDGLDLDAVLERLATHTTLHTTFDAVAFLFPSAGGRKGSGGGGSVTGTPVVPTVDPEPIAKAAPEMDPHTPARMLVSVMVADGELRAGEQRFVDSFLAREGLAPLPSRDLRVWRPHELGPVPDPALAARLVEACVHLCHLDQERDGSEWKLIVAYADALGVPRAQVEAWGRDYDRRYAPVMTRLMNALGGLFRR